MEIFSVKLSIFNRRPSKKLDSTLTKFTQFALPFHLDVIQQHKNNIEKVKVKQILLEKYHPFKSYQL